MQLQSSPCSPRLEKSPPSNKNPAQTTKIKKKMNSKFYVARILTQQKSSIICFHPSPGSSDNKESACDTGDEGLLSVLERSPKEGNGNHSSIPGEFHGQRSLVSYISWGRKESDTTEWLTLSLSSQPAPATGFTCCKYTLQRPRSFLGTTCNNRPSPLCHLWVLIAAFGRLVLDSCPGAAPVIRLPVFSLPLAP